VVVKLDDKDGDEGGGGLGGGTLGGDGEKIFLSTFSLICAGEEKREAEEEKEDVVEDEENM